MIPRMPVPQFDSGGTVVACPSSQNWRKAFFEYVDQFPDKWGFNGLMVDISFSNFTPGLCFNVLHEHTPGAVAQSLDEVMTTMRARLVERVGNDVTVSGEGQWDVATEWMSFTWDWLQFKDEDVAPFQMAFPRARQAFKVTDKKSLINRLFTAGYWLNVYLEEGGGRLKDYPELTDYLKSLAEFKKQFVQCMGRRDPYLYDLFVQATPDDGAWGRAHRSGKEALILATHRDGAAASWDLEIDLKEILGKGEKKVEVWSRTLEKLSSRYARDEVRLRLDIPAQDFVAVHVSE